MKNFITLVSLIEEWAEQKGILEKSTTLDQFRKTQEEVNELKESLEAQNMGLSSFKKSNGKLVYTKEEISDAIGDIVVTLIIQARMQNVDVLACLNDVFDIISKRKGKMINGQFVKEQ